MLPQRDVDGQVSYPLSYPLTDELRRGGVCSCLERNGVLWYSLPSGSLDSATEYLVTPLDPTFPVTRLPAEECRSYYTYRFQQLRGNWAYWHMGP